MEFIDISLVLLCFAAGLVDAVAGGGGLIQLPGLMIIFPDVAAARLIATNKIAAISGTGLAAYRYLKRFKLSAVELYIFGPLSLLGSVFGAAVISYADDQWIKPFLVVVLAAIFVLTFFTKAKSDESAPAPEIKALYLAGLCILVIGFYDGFLGPGTGGFFIFLAVQLLHFNYGRAGALGKYLNLMSNLGSLGFFAFEVELLWDKGVLMAVSNIAGAYVGSHLALKKGAKFIRTMMLIVTGALLIKLGMDVIY